MTGNQVMHVLQCIIQDSAKIYSNEPKCVTQLSKGKVEPSLHFGRLMLKLQVIFAAEQGHFLVWWA